MAFAMSAINLLIYWVGLHPAPGNLAHLIYRYVEIKKELSSVKQDQYTYFSEFPFLWNIGTNVPPSTGQLPIAFKSEILYDIHSLSSETRSQPGLGITFMICLA
jgi:hypothetical protein